MADLLSRNNYLKYEIKKDKKKCLEPESNQRHEDFQSSALPTELSGHVSYVISSGDRI